MLYLRLTGTPKDIYTELEPYYNDYRKLRVLTPQGSHIVHMDEFVDSLLNDEMAIGIALPYLDKRYVLEERGVLSPRVSVLEEEFEEMMREVETEDNDRKSEKREKGLKSEEEDSHDRKTAKSE